MRTPWGMSQHVFDIGDGIQDVGTASHGGYKLSPIRNSQVHKAWRVKGGWYEEDIAAAIVIFTFRGFFEEGKVTNAIHTLKNWYPDQYTEVTGKPVSVEESYVLRKRASMEANKGKWHTTCAYGSWHDRVPEGMVGVCARVDGSGPEAKYFLVSEEEYENNPNRHFGGIGFVVDPARHEEIAQL